MIAVSSTTKESWSLSRVRVALGRCTTVMVQVALAVPLKLETVMTAVPTSLAVMMPFLSTSATEGNEEVSVFICALCATVLIIIITFS